MHWASNIDTMDSIHTEKYPAKTHAKAVVSYLQASSGLIYLQGQKTHLIEDNDEPQPFRYILNLFEDIRVFQSDWVTDRRIYRQRRSFFYLSGCNLPDCHLTYNISASTLTLFIPPLDPDSVIVRSVSFWFGRILLTVPVVRSPCFPLRSSQEI